MKEFRHSSTKGFTLFEVMVAIMLLVLLVGGMFAVIHASMQAAATLSEAQGRGRETSALMELLRKTFRTLPAPSSVETRVRTLDGDSYGEIVFHGAPNAFSWGDVSTSLDEAVLTVKPQAGGRLSLVLARASPRDQLSGVAQTSTDEGRSVVLVADLKEVSWRFYDQRTGAWQLDWKNREIRPLLVELTLVPAGDSKPVKAVFWIPPLTRTS